MKFDQMSRVGSRDRHAGWRSKNCFRNRLIIAYLESLSQKNIKINWRKLNFLQLLLKSFFNDALNLPQIQIKNCKYNFWWCELGSENWYNYESIMKFRHCPKIWRFLIHTLSQNLEIYSETWLFWRVFRSIFWLDFNAFLVTLLQDCTCPSQGAR